MKYVFIPMLLLCGLAFAKPNKPHKPKPPQPTVQPTSVNTVDVDGMPFCSDLVYQNGPHVMMQPAMGQAKTWHPPTKVEAQLQADMLNAWKENKVNGIKAENTAKILAAADKLKLEVCRIKKDGDSVIITYSKKGVKDYSGPFFILRETKSSKIFLINPHTSGDGTFADVHLAMVNSKAMAEIMNGQPKGITPVSDMVDHMDTLGAIGQRQINSLFPAPVALMIHGSAGSTIIYRSRSKSLGRTYEDAVHTCMGKDKNIRDDFNADYVTDRIIGGSYYLKTEIPANIHLNNKNALGCVIRNIEEKSFAWSDMPDDPTDTNPDPTVTPTASPTIIPTIVPTVTPTTSPTIKPTVIPTCPPCPCQPTIIPTIAPTVAPTIVPTIKPTVVPTITPVIPVSDFVKNFPPCAEAIRPLLDHNGENRLPGYFIAKDAEMAIFEKLFLALDKEDFLTINSLLPSLEGKICRTKEINNLLFFDANHKRQFSPFFWRVGKIRVPGKPETYKNPIDPLIIEAPHIGHDGIAAIVTDMIQGTKGRLTIISGVHAKIGLYGCSEQWVHIKNAEKMKDGCVAANPVCADPNFKPHDHWSDGAHNVTTAFYREGAFVRKMYPYAFNIQQHGMGQHGDMDILFQAGTQGKNYTTSTVSGARLFGYELATRLDPRPNENINWLFITAGSSYPKWTNGLDMFRKTPGGGAICVTCSRMNAEGPAGRCMHVELAPNFKGADKNRITYAKALDSMMDRYVKQDDNKSNSVLPDWVN